MQIVTGTGSARKVYDIPSPSALKTWPRSEYLELHRAICDFFSIPVPADWGSHSVTQGRGQVQLDKTA